MRFLHVADVHLDTSFTSRSTSVRQHLRDASREAFERSVDLAISEGVHAFLIAGDLFDSERLSFPTERFLLDKAAQLGEHGITVVYATGNHDPSSHEDGPRPIPWPENVHVVSEANPQRLVISDDTGKPVGYVTASGHASTKESRDLSRLFPRPAGEMPEVGLLHTQVHSSLGATEHHSYAPSELSYLVGAGFDYWALGHVHVPQTLSEDPPVRYAGSLQGRTHKEQGERGALLVDLSDRDAPVIRFCSLATVRWDTVDVTHLDTADSLDDLQRLIQNEWAKARKVDAGTSDTKWMVRVILSGACNLWSELRDEENRDALADNLRHTLNDALDVMVVSKDVHAPQPIEEYRSRNDMLGEALRLCDMIREGKATLETLDPDDLAGLESHDPELVERYIRGLLSSPGTDAEVAVRLSQKQDRRKGKAHKAPDALSKHPGSKHQ